MRSGESVFTEIEHKLIHTLYSDEDEDENEHEDENVWRTQRELQQWGRSKKHCLNQNIAMETTKLWKSSFRSKLN